MWTAERAHGIYKRIVEEFVPPTMDEAIREELGEFVARRKAEGGGADGLLRYGPKGVRAGG